ncbi:hypothetical protein RJT34_11333 [Clitoria ternatea]|uniref:LOB domain-containing protein n=1 Tax=Clitoria ternatea TaxID=43366 RepID=A0AAN9JKC6_CLITE
MVPCGSCKLLRRRCRKDCIFAPYFPSNQPQKFAIVHKVYGASNVTKMLQEVPHHQRVDAVNSLVYEANARWRDPVYGVSGTVTYLQNQVSELQTQLAVAEAKILYFQMKYESMMLSPEIDTDEKSYFMQNDISQYISHDTSNNVNHNSFHKDGFPSFSNH